MARNATVKAVNISAVKDGDGRTRVYHKDAQTGKRVQGSAPKAHSKSPSTTRSINTGKGTAKSVPVNRVSLSVKRKGSGKVATTSSTSPKPATGGSGGGKPPVKTPASAPAGGSKPQGGKGLSTQVRQPRVEKYMGKAERVQTYLKNSSSQIKSGIKELKAKPLSALSRLFKSLPQGRAARMVAGGALGAGTAFTAGKIVGNEVEAKTRSAAEKRKAYEAARDDVPGRQTVPAKKEAPKAAPKEAPKGGSKASASKASGGKYPVYPKNSSQAASFRAAFASARKAGKKVFTWEGRKYNTKLKGE